MTATAQASVSGPNYTIDADPSRQLIQLTLVGHWSRATMTAYGRDLERALVGMAQAGGKPGHYMMLVDVREHAIQAQDIASELTALIASHAPLSRRVAIVMSGSALHKMQVVRISLDAKRRFFDEKDVALTWLLNGD